MTEPRLPRNGVAVTTRWFAQNLGKIDKFFLP